MKKITTTNSTPTNKQPEHTANLDRQKTPNQSVQAPSSQIIDDLQKSMNTELLLKGSVAHTILPIDPQPLIANELPERLSKLIEQLFDSETLQALIRKGMNVPQKGAHHNESILMHGHIDLIIQSIDELTNETPTYEESISENAKQHIKNIAHSENLKDRMAKKASLQRYALLHDLCKQDLLRITRTESPEDQTSDSTPNPEQINLDEFMERVINASFNTEQIYSAETVEKYMDTEQIEKIGYFHKEEGKARVNHGAAAVTKIKKDFHELTQHLDPDIFVAIDHHEQAHNFDQIHTGLAHKKFEQLTNKQIDWLVTASYIDTCGSIPIDKATPDLSEFNNLVSAIANCKHIYKAIELIQKHALYTASEKEETKAINGYIKTINNTKQAIDLEKAWSYLSLKILNPVYKIKEFQNAVTKSELSDAHKALVLDIINADSSTNMPKLKQLGRQLKAEYADIRPVLEDLKQPHPMPPLEPNQ